MMGPSHFKTELEKMEKMKEELEKHKREIEMLEKKLE